MPGMNFPAAATLRWTQDGAHYRRKADIRSWQEAEEVKRQLHDQLSGHAQELKPEGKNRSVEAAADLLTAYAI
jgi:hypothetical protein